MGTLPLGLDTNTNLVITAAVLIVLAALAAGVAIERYRCTRRLRAGQRKH